jgi:SNF family Na+-dependent transporter
MDPSPFQNGNLWRFPRVLAAHAEDGGLAFILCWLLFAALWSVPLGIAQSAIGRFKGKGVVEGFVSVNGFVPVCADCVTSTPRLTIVCALFAPRAV